MDKRTNPDATGQDVAETLHGGLCELLPRLRRLARAVAGDPDDADDLVQVTLERALARAGQSRSERPLAGWVFGILRHAWIDEVRSRRRGERLFAAEEAGERIGETPHERQEQAMSVATAMARLPEEQRMAVALVLIEDLSYREAAAALNDRLAAEPAASGIAIGLSFRAANGEYCRTFVLRNEQALAGLACRSDGVWRLPVLTETERLADGAMRLAAAALPAAVLAKVEARIEGEPLDAEAERAARDAGWR